MMLTPQLIFSTVLMLILQGIFSNLCESNEYSSPLANYHKLLGRRNSYDIWASKCQALGNGWNVARIDNDAELRFIEQAHIHAYDQRAYWIGGKSDNSFGIPINPSNLQDNGMYHVHTGTLIGQLRAYTIDTSSSLHGILCEQTKDETTGYPFSSAYSYYKKIMVHQGTPFADLSGLCSEKFGPGWAPAVFETFQEIDFIRAAQTRVFVEQNNAPYYVAGTIDINDAGLPNHCNATPSGSDHVIFRTPSTNQAFIGPDPAFMIRTILCEKAKI